jgi:plastocyanin
MRRAHARRGLPWLAAGLLLCAAGLAFGAPPARPAPATHTVVADATTFQPATITVKVGDTITWTNKDMFPHTATSKAGGFDSGVIMAGKSWTFTAKKKGSFPYECVLHPTMKGTLRVK